jgi:daunorubicin resistance ABC transporter ATP-binding subunit
MIEAIGIARRFKATKALDGVDVQVEAGRVMALLGPNGSGKTTLVRILSTLLRPDAGQARIAGYDVVRDAAALRAVIGLAGQYATVDELLTGRENLELVGLLSHLPKAVYRQRAQDALELLSLAGAGDAQVETYSGGMRRRLDLGASLMSRPPVLFLDEPTTGLDPRTRNDLWRFVQDLVAEGTTVLLTTQYMEEAEHLADTIVVIDAGRVVAAGTSDQLKDRLGGDVLEVRLSNAEDLDHAATLLRTLGSAAPRVDTALQQLSVPTTGGAQALMSAGRLLQDAGIAMDALGIRRPSLDDVFLAITEPGGAPAPTVEPPPLVASRQA